MVNRYVYSLTGTDYRGSFESRSAAEAAGLTAARKLAQPPSSIFVAKSIMRTPAAKGHARSILAHMSARGEAHGDSSYLANLRDAEIADLDSALEKTVLAWMSEHGKLPTSFRVESVSELTVPPAPAHAPAMLNGEVHDLGVGSVAEAMQ